MSASATMPYFIKPSINVDAIAKKAAYEAALFEINTNLDGETQMIMKMVTINCLLKTHLPYFYWTGFYIVHKGKLIVGPYQGTLGCLHIDFSKGVCGKAATEKITQIVDDVHVLTQGVGHIACDPNSQSEIVVPVFNKEKQLIAVFDVDSTVKQSFDEIDQYYLEQIMSLHFVENALETGFQV